MIQRVAILIHLICSLQVEAGWIIWSDNMSKCNTLSFPEFPECSENKCVLDCKEGWEEQGDYCFHWSSESDTWTGAGSTCKREGANLASITSSAIDDYVVKEMEGRDIPILWIGGSDREVEGNWLWAGCADWDFTKWGENQPSNEKHHDCLTYNKFTIGGNTWNDANCKSVQKFLCSQHLCSGTKTILLLF